MVTAIRSQIAVLLTCMVEKAFWRLRMLIKTLFSMALLVTSVTAQLIPGQDKEHGESYQIKMRREYFEKYRGLDHTSQFARQRKSSVEKMKLEIEEIRHKANAGLQLAATWKSLGPSPMTMLNWRMGYVAGRISALAIDWQAPNIMYLGAASGGVWKSLDRGLTWTEIGQNLGSQSIGSILVDPHNHERIWVGTGEHAQSCHGYFGQGLYRSDDGGSTFIEVNGSGNASLNLSYIASIIVHPENENIVLAGGHGYCLEGNYLTGGLFRSENGGQTWAKLHNGAVNDLVQDPSNTNRMFMAMGRWGAFNSGIYESTDGGQTWRRLSGGLPPSASMRRSRIALSQNNPNTLYALINGDDEMTDLYRSDNSGQSWTLVNSDACEGQCSYNLCLTVHPDDPDTVIVGTIRFFASYDGGRTLTPMVDTWGGAQRVHQDIHVLLWDPHDINTFWIGSDGGLWGTPDQGRTFYNYNNGLNITQFYDIAVFPDDANSLLGGSQDNSSLKTTGREIWDVTLVTGDGFMNLIDPVHPDYIFQTSYPYEGYPNVFWSDNRGRSFFDIEYDDLGKDEPWPWKTPMEIAAPLTPSHKTPVFLASDRVYRSFDYGTSWVRLSDSLVAESDNSISVMTARTLEHDTLLYVGTEDGKVHRCENALSSAPVWTDVTGTIPGSLISDIAIDPTAPDTVYVTRAAFGGSKLYLTTDAGTSWQAVGNGLPNVPANSVCVDPRLPSRIFVGTDIGVYFSVNSGLDFAPFNQGMPLGNVIVDMEIDDDPYVLTAGTYGRGAWQARLPLTKSIPIPELYEKRGNRLGATPGVEATLCLTNPDTEPVTYELRYINSTGKTIQTSIEELKPRAHTLRSLGDGQIAEVKLSGSTLPHCVLLKQDSTKLAGLWQPDFSPQSSLLVTHIARDRNLFYTGFGLSVSSETRVNWLDEYGSHNGIQIQHSASFELQDIVGDQIPGFGTFQCENTGSFIIGSQSFGTLNEWQRAAMLPLGTQPESRIIYPHIASNTEFFWTGIIALNPGANTSHVQVKYWDKEGLLLQEDDFVLTGGSRQVLLFDNVASTVESSIPIDVFPESVAWMEMTSNREIVGLELFGSTNAAGDYMEGIRASGQTFNHAVAPYLHIGDNKWFGTVLVNPSDSAVNISMVLRNEDGMFSSEYSFTLNPGQKLTTTLKALFNTEELEQAKTLWVEAEGDAKVAGMVLFGDEAQPRLQMGGYELIPVYQPKLGVFNP
ncbi:MAG: hypothetical protein CSA81_03890 [Acidobacteria bacterium]|nr:MAG: hypothetical protein CSA81_03890 [Acidobacteriota bacterium]